MRRFGVGLLGLWALAMAAVLALGQAGFRINTSASVPEGVYRVVPGPPALGAVVAVCPPDTPVFRMARARGYVGRFGACPDGSGELFKVLAATHGDTVQNDPEGVRINGRLWPGSAPRARDAGGRPLPRLRLSQALGPNQVVVMSAEGFELGFDSRYFGPLDAGRVRGRAVRVPVDLSIRPRAAADRVGAVAHAIHRLP
jgi:conjugative transfer signal peptidase TraF